MRAIDLTGQRFGRLTVEKRYRNNNGRAQWLCYCDCGTVVVAQSYLLRKGLTRSCGCLRKETARENAKKHGGRKTRLYNIWCAIKHRCTNRSAINYKDYGGRGIIVCAEWENSFEAFQEWALANGYRDDLSIERIDNDGPYTPDNCRWATRSEQGRNRRSNYLVEYNGETHPLIRWAELTGIKYGTLHRRLTRGWTVEKALTTK